MLRGYDCVSLGMHLELSIESIWRLTSRPESSEPRDALWDHDAVRL